MYICVCSSSRVGSGVVICVLLSCYICYSDYAKKKKKSLQKKKRSLINTARCCMLTFLRSEPTSLFPTQRLHQLGTLVHFQTGNILDILENGQPSAPSESSKGGGAADLLDLLGDLGPPQPVPNSMVPAVPLGPLDGLLSPSSPVAPANNQMNGSAG